MPPLSNQELTDSLNDIIRVVNLIQTAITNLASKKQLEQLNFINRSDITDLQDRISAVEADIKLIKSQL